MKKKTSQIASLLLAVTVIFSIFSIPTAFAAAEGFQSYTGEFGTVIDRNVEIGTTGWISNELTRYATVSVIKEPENETNYVVNIKGVVNSTRDVTGKGLVNNDDVSVGTQNSETSIKFKLARETEESKALTVHLQSTSGTRMFIMRFDLITGQFTVVNDAMTISPAGSTLYIQELRNAPLAKGEWVDIEILLLPGGTKRAMIYANGKPLVYGADSADGTVSAGRPMLPLVANSTIWPNNTVKTIYFMVPGPHDSDPAEAASSFWLDDIDREKMSGIAEDCSLTLIDRIAPVLDDYSTTIASPKIINTDMLLPSVGENGAAIAWNSDDVEIVDGRVILPDADDFTEATLTATVTQTDAEAGTSATLTQSWTVKLAPRNMAKVESALVEGGLLKSVTLSKKCELPEDCKVLVGVYDKETGLYSAFKVLTPAENSDVITLTEDVAVGANDKVKVFVWNIDTLTPLADSFSN